MYVYIIVTIIVSLSAFACYALISQAIENQHIQKQRILMMLKTKHRNLLHMNTGFPKYFLTSDLATFIYKALIDTCGQLSSIEPSNQRYQQEIDSCLSQIREISVAASMQKVRIDSPHQLKEIRQHLQELQAYLLQQAELRTINKKQYSAYQYQVKHLGLQLDVDTYTYHAEDAQHMGKQRLAIHYLTLAKKLLLAEKASPAYGAQINKIESLITLLEAQALAADENPEAQTEEPNSESNEGPSASPKKEKETESWKKKQVYD
jgi:hypothetical protein